MRYNAWATVLIGLSALCLTACSVSRQATERFFAEQSGKAERRVESSELREARDSLREEPTNEARAETKLFGFAELGRDSAMPESELSPLRSLLPRLGYAFLRPVGSKRHPSGCRAARRRKTIVKSPKI